MLVLNFVVVIAIPPAPAMARETPLFNFHKQYFERQPFVGEDAREVDELFEHVKQRSLFGTAATGDDLPAFPLALDQVLANDNWLHDEDVMFFKQRFDLVANGR